MSKKSFTFLVIILLVIIGIGWYFLSRPATSNPNGGNNASSSDLFPFGQNPTGTTGGNTNQPATNPSGTTATTTTIDLTNGGQNLPSPALRQISLVPTAGIVAFDVGSTTMVRYMERATGHISETVSDSSVLNQISNITIPKVHETLWSTDGSKLLIRYLKDDNQTIRTFYAQISTSTTPDHSLSGLFLADGIKDISVLGSKVFYFNEASNGDQGVTANMDGSAKTSVFNSSFNNWGAVWTSPTAITIFTKPSGLAEGSAYALNPTTGNYSLVVNGIMGLTALGNADGTAFLYSGANGNTVGTRVFDMKAGASAGIGVVTLSDKCVWSKKQKSIVYCAVPSSIQSGTYPDDWYKGKISFSDSLWRIDTSSGATKDVLDPEFEPGGASMDMMNLGLDQNETALVFINKTDMTAWRYRLSQ